MTLNKPDWWDDWTTYNPEKMEVELKEDAPPKVRREWNAIQKVMFPELPEKSVE